MHLVQRVGFGLDMSFSRIWLIFFPKDDEGMEFLLSQKVCFLGAVFRHFC